MRSFSVRVVWARVREIFRRSAIGAERDDEFRFHLDMETAENIRRGMSAAEARRVALVRFGGRQRFREETQDAERWQWLERWSQHFRYAVRALRRQPAFSVAAILTLALGIGFNTALFSVFYSLGFRSFDVHEGDRLVNVFHVLEGERRRPVHGVDEMISWQDFVAHAAAIRADDSRIESAAVYASTELTLTAQGAAAAHGQWVSCGYFATLGVRMMMGRAFADDECARRGEPALAVLSHSAWVRHLGGDSAVIGRRVRINQTTFTVVGIAEQGFAGLTLQPVDVWLPVTMQMTVDRGDGRDSLFVSDWSWLTMVARLSPGATADEARAQLAVTARQRDRLFPGRQTRVVVHRGALLNFPEARERGAVIAAAFGLLGVLVVVMICANLMNLLLARGLARRREIGIRLAVGASRGRLVEQLLVESGLLALIGGTLGFALSLLLPAVVPKLLPVPLQLDLSPDGRVLAFTVFVSLATALVFGLLPAWRATRVDLVSAFKGGVSGAGRDMRPYRLRSAIVGVQVAGSALLLIVASLLVRAARHGASIDLGYTTRGVATFELNLPMLGYSSERARATYDALVRRLEATPGVQAVSLAAPLPLLGRRSDVLRVAPGNETINPSMVNATASHFATLGIDLVAGRAFTEAEVAAAGIAGEQPVVVSRSLANSLAGGASPLGKRLIRGDVSYRVVGVAADAHMTQIGGGSHPFIYLPAHPGRDQDLFVLVRSAGSLVPIERLVPQLAAALDPSIVVKTQRLSDRYALELTPARLSSGIAGTMGALTLLLALVGIYGVVSYAVAQRTRDIAVRRALGANDGSVVRLMMRHGSRSVIIGLVVGAALAVAASRALGGLLLGVSPLDALSFGGAIGALLVTAGLATWIPARRASRVDPARILRED